MYYLYVFQIGAFLHEGKIAGENGVCRSVPVIHASVAGCQLQTEIICIQRAADWLCNMQLRIFVFLVRERAKT